MLLLPLLVLTFWQDPIPEVKPEAQNPTKVTREEIEAKLAKVKETYADADRSLTKSVENPESLLAEATAVAERLVAEMEDLLAALPAPPPPPPNNSDKPPPPNQKDPNRPKPQPQPDKPQATPLRDMPLSEFLRDPRDGTWGKLPPRLQQTIDSASAEEVPLRYRRWLVEYHRQGIRNEK